jgi:hypothetical protein
MKTQTIIIEIDREGGITADADGFTGDACLRDLETLLEGLGAGTQSVERKPDQGTARTTRHRRQTVGKKS